MKLNTKVAKKKIHRRILANTLRLCHRAKTIDDDAGIIAAAASAAIAKRLKFC